MRTKFEQTDKQTNKRTDGMSDFIMPQILFWGLKIVHVNVSLHRDLVDTCLYFSTNRKNRTNQCFPTQGWGRHIYIHFFKHKNCTNQCFPTNKVIYSHMYMTSVMRNKLELAFKVTKYPQTRHGHGINTDKPKQKRAITQQ